MLPTGDLAGGRSTEVEWLSSERSWREEVCVWREEVCEEGGKHGEGTGVPTTNLGCVTQSAQFLPLLFHCLLQLPSNRRGNMSHYG